MKAEMCLRGCHEQITHSPVAVPTDVMVKVVSIVKWVDQGVILSLDPELLEGVTETLLSSMSRCGSPE